MSQQWSVKALNAYLKLKLDNDFLIQNISIIGEISNFNHHNQRHMYFTLKDETSRISCVMFASSASKVNFVPKNGMEVVLTANVSMFEASGSLQLYVLDMQQSGVGDLALKFEKLKQDLNKEGLFDTQYKKSFPAYPRRIAVVSGRDSAALNDILTTLKRRWPVAHVEIFNSLVQGNTAHLEIIEHLNNIDDKGFDAIILARGGGSIEDLWAFNEEALARTIFKLKTPIVSGVGHEIDFTISDFVSDLRAPTPTAAAEMITPDIQEVKLLVSNLSKTLNDHVTNKLNMSTQLVDTYSNSPVYQHPELITLKYKEVLVLYKNEMFKFKDNKLKEINDFKHLSNNLISMASDLIKRQQITLNNMNNNLNHNMNTYNTSIRNNFLKQMELIDSYSPINTLKRGYSMVEVNDKVVSSIHNINISDEINVRMQDGSVIASVLKKEKNNG